MSTSLSRDADATDVTSHAGGSTLATNTWYYLIYSFLMTDGKDTIIDLFVDNTSDGILSAAGKFFIDATTFEGYIAVERTTSASTWGSHWNGYIYEFILYQSEHTVSNTGHVGTCATGCSTLNF